MLRNKRLLLRLIVAVLSCSPILAMAAGWDDTLQEYGRNIRIGLYALGGTIAVSTLIWSGIQWLISRSNGDHQHTFMDYLKQAAAIGAVGASIVLATGMWQAYGSGSPV